MLVVNFVSLVCMDRLSRSRNPQSPGVETHRETKLNTETVGTSGKHCYLLTIDCNLC